MNLPPELRCPEHGAALYPTDALPDGAPALTCAAGCHVPVTRDIPRFVAGDDYATSFGLQWNRYRRTQLDSHTGTAISRERLRRCLGGRLEGLAGATVLEAGCGAGRFTEILLEAAARVIALDLSSAVEANLETCRGRPGHYVAQADLLKAPVAPRSMDLVLCLGVIQHTPDPERTMAALASYVKPGGQLVLDHYTFGPGKGLGRRCALALHPRSALRALLLRLPPRLAMSLAGGLVRALLPLHRTLWRRNGLARALRRGLRLVSPLFDYYDRHPDLKPELLAEWSFLDTHDGLTDRYKHFRSREEIERTLGDLGLVEIEVRYAGNGVEARARRPELR